MDIVLYAGDNISDITVRGKFIDEQAHRISIDTYGRTVISVGEMNTPASAKVKSEEEVEHE